MPKNIFNKIREEKFPNLKKNMPIKIQVAYKKPNRLDKKKKVSLTCDKTLNERDKKIIKKCKEKD